MRHDEYENDNAIRGELFGAFLLFLSCIFLLQEAGAWYGKKDIIL